MADRDDRAPTVGRTPWDAVAEALQLLRGAAPYVIIAALVGYGFLEYKRSFEDTMRQIAEAREKATAENREQIKALNEQLSSTYAQIQNFQAQRMETVERTLSIHDKVSQAIVENLEDVVSLQAKLKQQERELEKTRTALDAEKSKRDEAVAEKNEAIAQKQELSRQITDLERTAEVVSRLSDVLSDERPIPRPYRITSLSARYEGQEPAHIGQDLAGTFYYGTYRTQGSNEFTQFLRMLSEKNPVLAGILERAGGAEAATSGSETFRSAWISIATDPGLAETEYAFVKKTVYDPVVRFLARSRAQSGMGMNVDTRSTALRAVIWSTAVQHGVANAKRLVLAALGDTAPLELSDEEIMRRIYNERKNTRTWFPDANALLARLLRVRYDLELRDALKMLAEERQQ